MKNPRNFDSLKNIFTYGDKIRPTRDWFVLLAISAVLLLVNVAWNAYLFTEIENGKAIGGSTTAAVQKSSSTTVTQVQDILKARATEEGSYQNKYHFVDPSVPSG